MGECPAGMRKDVTQFLLSISFTCVRQLAHLAPHLASPSRRSLVLCFEVRARPQMQCIEYAVSVLPRHRRGEARLLNGEKSRQTSEYGYPWTMGDRAHIMIDPKAKYAADNHTSVTRDVGSFPAMSPATLLTTPVTCRFGILFSMFLD